MPLKYFFSPCYDRWIWIWILRLQNIVSPAVVSCEWSAYDWKTEILASWFNNEKSVIKTSCLKARVKHVSLWGFFLLAFLFCFSDFPEQKCKKRTSQKKKKKPLSLMILWAPTMFVRFKGFKGSALLIVLPQLPYEYCLYSVSHKSVFHKKILRFESRREYS